MTRLAKADLLHLPELGIVCHATKPAVKWNLHGGNEIEVWPAEDGRPVSVFILFCFLSFVFFFIIIILFYFVFILFCPFLFC